MFTFNLFKRKGTRDQVSPLEQTNSSRPLTDKEPPPSTKQSPPIDFIFVNSKGHQLDNEITSKVHRRESRLKCIPSSEHRCDVDMDQPDSDPIFGAKIAADSKERGSPIRDCDRFSVLTCEDMTASSQSSPNTIGRYFKKKKKTEPIKGSWEDKNQTTLIWI